MILYHELTILNLMEVLFFSKEACLSLNDYLLDLVDYCARSVQYLITFEPKQPQKQGIQELLGKTPKMVSIELF